MFLLELIEYCVCVVSQKTNHCCEMGTKKGPFPENLYFDHYMIGRCLSIHYSENFTNYKLMVNNLALQYVNWIKRKTKQNKNKKKDQKQNTHKKPKKHYSYPFIWKKKKKKVWKKEKSIRATDLKSLSIMSITILNNQLDGSLASDTPVFPKILSFQSICPMFTTFLTIVALSKSIWKKFQVQNFIPDFRFEI